MPVQHHNQARPEKKSKNGSKKAKNILASSAGTGLSCPRNGFSKVSSEPKIITESINLHFSGMSLRKISRHVKVAHGRKISHVAVYKWIEKYMGIIGAYVDSIVPNTGDVWSLDEMVLNVKGTKKAQRQGVPRLALVHNRPPDQVRDRHRGVEEAGNTRRQDA